MPVSNPPSFIGRKVLVSVPQWSKFGDSGAEFGGSWECNIAETATPLNKKTFLKCCIGLKFI
jgi:hypothetical protein